MSTVNQRLLSRTALRIACRVRGKNLSCRNASIHTLNISKRGLLTIWENASTVPRVGELLEIEVPLPGHPAFGVKCMYFNAAVKRVEQLDENRFVVAVQASKSGFRPLHRNSGLPLATSVVQ